MIPRIQMSPPALFKHHVEAKDSRLSLQRETAGKCSIVYLRILPLKSNNPPALIPIPGDTRDPPSAKDPANR